MKKRILWMLVATAMVSSTMTAAYEITTHALITDYAYRLSALNPANPNSITPTLGFDRLDIDYPFTLSGASENTPIAIEQRWLTQQARYHPQVPTTSGSSSRKKAKCWMRWYPEDFSQAHRELQSSNGSGHGFFAARCAKTTTMLRFHCWDGKQATIAILIPLARLHVPHVIFTTRSMTVLTTTRTPARRTPACGPSYGRWGGPTR
jgi:hypothetical protein